MFPLLGKAKTTTITLLKTLVGQGVCMGWGGGGGGAGLISKQQARAE